MLMTVRITTAEREALMVPETAPMQRRDEVFVFTVDEGRAQIRQIVHGSRNDGWVEILEGLDVGEAVITEGVIKVRQGSAVSTDDTKRNRASSRPPEPKVG